MMWIVFMVFFISELLFYTWCRVITAGDSLILGGAKPESCHSEKEKAPARG